MNDYDVIIIGAGPAGLTAAIYVQRAGYRSVVLEEYVAGGQMANTPEVENYPAVGKISGVELGMNLYNQVLEQGAQVEFDGVASADLTGKVKSVVTQSGRKITAGAVIIANGAKRRKLGVPGEEEYSGRGVSYCATCDGMFYRGKTVVVVGGGNTAVSDVLYLSRLCEKVYLVHRRDTLRASKVYLDPLQKAENVEFVWDSEVKQLLRDQAVTGVRVRNKKTGEERDIPCDGVFVAVGYLPNTELYRGQVELDEAGYVLADETTQTNLPGVFAVGDLRKKPLRQVVTAASDGAVAAHFIEEYLNQ